MFPRYRECSLACAWMFRTCHSSHTNANTDYTAPSADDHGVLWVRKRQLPTIANIRLPKRQPNWI